MGEEQMSKSKAQGTRLESAVVERFRGLGLPARRIAEGGSKDIGDVYVKGSYLDEPPLVALVWHRLVKGNGKRRTPDGLRRVAVLDFDAFVELVRRAESNVIIECKATERLNVTRTLAKAVEKARRR